MRQFFKFVFASCLGVALAFFLVIFVLFSVAGVIASSFGETTTVKISPNSVLKLDLNQIIPEKTNNVVFDPFSIKQEGVLGLHDMVKLIDKASSDKNIKALYLTLNNPGLGNASARYLREAIKRFKDNGKTVIAYSDYYGQGNYYIASVADKVYLNPIGSISFEGFGILMPYFKNMLDKIGVEMQVFYAGQFKSATEPFRSDRMSEQNRLQTKEYLNELHSIFLEDIAESRKISADSLKSIANGYLSRNAESAVSTGLADALKYEDEVLDELKTLIGLEPDAKLKTVSLQKYKNSQSGFNLDDSNSKDKIAVVYAEGEINDGSEMPGEINGDNYVKLLRKIREDKKIKAVVLRVNSPGGSVLASEKILRELQLIKKKNIPIVVSMGDVAASGGYYISCAADKIIAEENTITGSIGVFTLIPNVEKLMNEKIGITFDTVRTNTYSTSFNTIYKFSENERDIIQKGVEEIYERFLSIVGNNRKMSRDDVHAIAQGRVWSGRKAKEIGLVDILGNLETAKDEAAKLAGISDYKTIEYPKTKEPIEQIIEQLMGGMDETLVDKNAQKVLGDQYPIYKMMMSVKNQKGIQARLPHQIFIP
jgi:protease IV